MIKRYEIRPRRKRAPNGNGAEPAAVPGVPAAHPAEAAPAHAAPIAPIFEEK
jgi:hypothetical protein